MLPSDLICLGIYSVTEAIYFLFLINDTLGTLDSYSRISSLVTFGVFPLSSYNTTLLFHYEMGSKLRVCSVRLQFKKKIITSWGLSLLMYCDLCHFQIFSEVLPQCSCSKGFQRNFCNENRVLWHVQIFVWHILQWKCWECL